uniref:Uncharacterized protein n=1 Tax=Myotis myotis TaxID=51298 RepID=A0A7J7YE23_MYOMY|nr:hypothetical protein mMyoMyo1_011083 [Myotis myotis]
MSSPPHLRSSSRKSSLPTIEEWKPHEAHPCPRSNSCAQPAPFICLRSSSAQASCPHPSSSRCVSSLPIKRNSSAVSSPPHLRSSSNPSSLAQFEEQPHEETAHIRGELATQADHPCTRSSLHPYEEQYPCKQSALSKKQQPHEQPTLSEEQQQCAINPNQRSSSRAQSTPIRGAAAS